uniref:Uncharacterized protein n=1 Tax=Cacopsylla melanoneura TaxID=428564 RepID=A0A8D8TW53_9HEMI
MQNGVGHCTMTEPGVSQNLKKYNKYVPIELLLGIIMMQKLLHKIICINYLCMGFKEVTYKNRVIIFSFPSCQSPQVSTPYNNNIQIRSLTLLEFVLCLILLRLY